MTRSLLLVFAVLTVLTFATPVIAQGPPFTPPGPPRPVPAPLPDEACAQVPELCVAQ